MSFINCLLQNWKSGVGICLEIPYLFLHYKINNTDMCVGLFFSNQGIPIYMLILLKTILISSVHLCRLKKLAVELIL